MFSLLLAVIYLAFISLGLPDSLLGSAWPLMRLELGAPLSYAGVISTVISVGTIISSLLSDRLTGRFGAGRVTAVSVAMTAAALFGFSLSPSVWVLCLWAIPYGLGAGAIDAALNNYVALHYSSRHMSWLHCFWGVGASLSPVIMRTALSLTGRWQLGYRSVSLIQIVLTVLLFLSLPLWKVGDAASPEPDNPRRPIGLRGALRIPGVPAILLAFFAYCGAESTAGLWASSYLAGARGVDARTAAGFASLFYLGITFGRFLNGFIADRMGDRRSIRLGAAVMALGALLILLPIPSQLPALAGLLIFGLGCAPVYPSVIHSTPAHFGAENSQAVIGIQMAGAYVGTTCVPPLFGVLANSLSLQLYPYVLLVMTALLLYMAERTDRICAGRGQK